MFGDILQSASRIVLIMLAITACVGFIMGKLEAKDFMMLTGMVFAFYFTVKSSDSQMVGAGK